MAELKVKQFSRESIDGQTDGRYQTYYLPYFTVLKDLDLHVEIGDDNGVWVKYQLLIQLRKRE